MVNLVENSEQAKDVWLIAQVHQYCKNFRIPIEISVLISNTLYCTFVVMLIMAFNTRSTKFFFCTKHQLRQIDAGLLVVQVSLLEVYFLSKVKLDLSLNNFK